jgi:hypothetical protein
MPLKKLYLFIILGLNLEASTRLTQIKNIKQTASLIAEFKKRHKLKNLLICLDIDNTLIKPLSHVGSDQWFQGITDDHEKKGYTRQKSLLNAHKLTTYARQYVPATTVEKETHQEIKNLASLGATIALTKRTPCNADVTIELLRQCHIDLSKQLPYAICEDYFLPHHARHKLGHIFCSGNSKGTVLKAFLDKNFLEPDGVVLIDDKHECLEETALGLSTTSSKFLGIEYTHAHRWIRSYNHQKAMSDFEKITGKKPEEILNQD